jgi:hypothetical protein
MAEIQTWYISKRYNYANLLTTALKIIKSLRNFVSLHALQCQKSRHYAIREICANTKVGNYCISLPTSIPWNQRKSRRCWHGETASPTPTTKQIVLCQCIADVSAYIKAEVEIRRNRYYSRTQRDRSRRGDISIKRHGESNQLHLLANVISSGITSIYLIICDDVRIKRKKWLGNQSTSTTFMTGNILKKETQAHKPKLDINFGTCISCDFNLVHTVTPYSLQIYFNYNTNTTTTTNNNNNNNICPLMHR